MIVPSDSEGRRDERSLAVRVLAKQPVQALESLRLALEKGYSPQLMQVDPELFALRNNPDFRKLMMQYPAKLN